MRRIVAFALLLTAAGCVPSEPAFDNDPLVGGRPLPRNGTAPASPYNPSVASASPTAPTAGPLQLPPPTGTVSPAALASGSSPAADASSLRIGPPPPTIPGALAGPPPVGSDAWHGAASNTVPVLKGPEPLADGGAVKPIAVIAPPTPVGPPFPAVSGPAALAAASDYGQLEDMLAQRGVLFQSLEGPDDHGAWRFRCGVPSRDMPGATHNFELAVPGDHGLAAMKAVLGQIDQYQRPGR